MASYRWIDNKERVAIAKLLKKGCTFAEIARALDRTKSAISKEIERQGGRENYTPERFEESLEAVEEAKSTVKQSRKSEMKTTKNIIVKKLDNLEAQMELMLFTIQSIRDHLEHIEELSS